MRTFTVTIWGSDPDLGNDDCWVGEDFVSLDEAMQAFNHPTSGAFSGYLTHNPLTEGEYIEILGPDVYAVRAFTKGEWTVSKRQRRISDGLWASERMWETRMLHGIVD